MVGKRGLDRYQFSYLGDYRRYGSSHGDGYADHQFQFDGSWRFSLRNAFKLMYQYRLGHEARGEGLTEGFMLQGDKKVGGDATFGRFNIAEPLRFKRSEVGGRYSYGAPDARGKLSWRSPTRSWAISTSTYTCMTLNAIWPSRSGRSTPPLSSCSIR